MFCSMAQFFEYSAAETSANMEEHPQQVVHILSVESPAENQQPKFPDVSCMFCILIQFPTYLSQIQNSDEIFRGILLFESIYLCHLYHCDPREFIISS